MASGPQCSPEKQLLALYTNFNKATIIQAHWWKQYKNIIISIMRTWWSLIWRNFNLQYPRMFVLSLVEIGGMILKNSFFASCQYIFSVSPITSNGKRVWPSIKKKKKLLTQGCFVQSLVEISLFRFIGF